LSGDGEGGPTDQLTGMDGPMHAEINDVNGNFLLAACTVRKNPEENPERTCSISDDIPRRVDHL